jgi:hypothetical protein
MIHQLTSVAGAAGGYGGMYGGYGLGYGGYGMYGW